MNTYSQQGCFASGVSYYRAIGEQIRFCNPQGQSRGLAEQRIVGVFPTQIVPGGGSVGGSAPHLAYAALQAAMRLREIVCSILVRRPTSGWFLRSRISHRCIFLMAITHYTFYYVLTQQATLVNMPKTRCIVETPHNLAAPAVRSESTQKLPIYLQHSNEDYQTSSLASNAQFHSQQARNAVNSLQGRGPVPEPAAH